MCSDRKQKVSKSTLSTFFDILNVPCVQPRFKASALSSLFCLAQPFILSNLRLIYTQALICKSQMTAIEISPTYIFDVAKNCGNVYRMITCVNTTLVNDTGKNFKTFRLIRFN